MRFLYAVGHPTRLVSDILPPSPLMRLKEFLVSRGISIQDYRDIKMKNLYGICVNDILDAIKGKGLRKSTKSDLEEALEQLPLWYIDAGKRIPFAEDKIELFESKKSISELIQREYESNQDCGEYIHLKEKHRSALEMILKDSSHPLAKDMLCEWESQLKSDGDLIIQSTVDINWTECSAGYSIVDPNSKYEPLIDVYARWDAEFGQFKLSVIQVEPESSIEGCVLEVYLNLDTEPKRLCLGNLDFQIMNESIYKELQKMMPTQNHYNVVPDRMEQINREDKGNALLK